MTGIEVQEQINAELTPAHCCVKSWKDDHKLVDFELIGSFMRNLKGDENLEGFALLDLEQMWNALTELDPDNLNRIKMANGELIEWVWIDKNGKEKTNSYPFTPEGIMTIMNDEFFA